MNLAQWNHIISCLPAPHLLQSAEWAEVKSRYGWQPAVLVWLAGEGSPREYIFNDTNEELPTEQSVVAAALILKKSIARRLPLKTCVLYSPKGPLLDWHDQDLRRLVLSDLAGYAKRHGAIFLKLDPDIILSHGIPGAEDEQIDPAAPAILADLASLGYHPSDDQIQFRNTVLLDVNAGDDDLLARMKQKTRYNVRLGSKKGLTVRVGTPADRSALYRMYAETSVRDGFVIRDEAYYQTVWGIFTNNAEPLIAEVEGEPVAAVYLFHFAGTAYYIYGMSRDLHRDKMPNYLLQFEAMRWARQKGCAVYDLWGAPDVFDESDSMWGVFRFKEGLGGRVRNTPGAWDIAPNPWLYQLYTRVMPALLGFLRSRGKARVKEQTQLG
jgi:lipid II:glycine glycyltransferase (peptidoglycan interpeptide bridge formation enzyme)